MNLSNDRFSWILDAKGQRLIILEHLLKIATVTHWNLEGSQPMWGFTKFPVNTKEFTLLFNLPCHKVLLSDNKTGTEPAGEVWIAENMGIVVKDAALSKDGNTMWQASSIVLGEPPTAEFEIPPSYKLMNQ